MAATQYEIKEELLRFPGEEGDPFRRELNLVSWFGREAKYDIRGWTADRSKMTKGISLTEEEFKTLINFGKTLVEGE